MCILNLVKHYNIVIVGAGPVGATLSLLLSKNKIEHLIIDKSDFPRDKICGDGFTPEVARVLREISEDLYLEFINAPWVLPSNGSSLIISDDLKITFDYSKYVDGFSPYYVAKRIDFDDFLVKKLPSKYATVCLKHELLQIEKQYNNIKLKVKDLDGDKTIDLTCDLIIGADGVRSVVKKFMHPQGLKNNKDHYGGAVRCYFKNVEKKFDFNPLELYTVPKLKSAYFWIFHLPNNECNVGIGSLSSNLAKNKVSIREYLFKFIEENPELKKRFENSIPLEKPVGWGIPFNSNAVDYVGDNYMLIGDSGSMAEPLTGKGIGVSMLVALQAIPVIIKALQTNDYSKKTLVEFEHVVEKKFRKEWNVLYKVQSLSNNTFLFKLLFYFFQFKFINRITSEKFMKDLNKFINKPHLVNRKND
jgi:geranylgeranyl reductase family protein